MSVVLTAPGVYVEEIPSGSRSIAGVATSVTAFVGGAPRGPLNVPTLCENNSDFERLFGGLHRDSPMSQAVRHFYLNGGRQALIVRVTNSGAGVALLATTGLTTDATLVGFQAVVSNMSGTSFTLTITGIHADGSLSTDATASGTVDLGGADPQATIEGLSGADGALVTVDGALPTAAPPEGTWVSGPNGSGVQTLVVGPAARTASAILGTDLQLVAANPGAWGNRLRAAVSTTDAPPGTFHLTLSELDDAGNPRSQEVHYAVSHDSAHARWLPRVLSRRSQLCRVGSSSFAAPAGGDVAQLSGGHDGSPATQADVLGSDLERTGMYALRNADIFNLLCLPLESWSTADASLWTAAMTFVEEERAFLIVDPPEEWATASAATSAVTTFAVRSDNAALYFPRIVAADPLQEGRAAEFPPCGVVAGIMARTDAQRGIWKAPAGIDTTARGVVELAVRLTDGQQGVLNDFGVNAFRTFPTYGNVLWGARTLSGANVLASEWKYVPVRRLALYLHESLYRGSQWAVFEPNDEPLWSELRLAIGSFLHGLFRQGAFAGASPLEAYFVKCDRETTTQADIDLGIVNVLVGFAPLKPAEFVVLRIQQLVSQAG